MQFFKKLGKGQKWGVLCGFPRALSAPALLYRLLGKHTQSAEKIEKTWSTQRVCVASDPSRFPPLNKNTHTHTYTQQLHHPPAAAAHTNTTLITSLTAHSPCWLRGQRSLRWQPARVGEGGEDSGECFIVTMLLSVISLLCVCEVGEERPSVSSY